MSESQDAKKESELTALLEEYKKYYGKSAPKDVAKKKEIIIKIRDLRNPKFKQFSNSSHQQRLGDALSRLSEIWAITQTGVGGEKDFTFEKQQLRDIVKEERAHIKDLQNVDFKKYSNLDKIMRIKATQRALRIKNKTDKTKEKDDFPSLWKLSWDAFKDNWKNTSGYKSYIGFSAGFSLVHGVTAWVTGAATNMMNANILHGGINLKTGVFLFTGIGALQNVFSDFVYSHRNMIRTNVIQRRLDKEIKEFRKRSSKLFLRSKSSSQITTFLNEKSSAYADLSTGLVDIGRAVATAATAMSVLITTYPELGAIGAGIGLGIGACGGALWKYMNTSAQPLFRKAANIKSNRVETMANAAYDKGSVREAQVDRDMKTDAQREAELQNAVVNSRRRLEIGIDTGLTLGCAAIAAFCAEKIGLGGSVGDLITFSGSLAASSWAAFRGILSYLYQHQHYVHYKDADKQLRMPEDMRIKTGPEKIPYKDNVVEMRDVQFSYNKSEKQMDMGKQSLVFEPGKLQCIVGESGNGKTTLVDLMTHVRDIDHGEVFINGVNLDTTSEEEIRKHVCLHDQDNNHFDKIKSVRRNIEMYIPNADEVKKRFDEGTISQKEYSSLMDMTENPKKYIDRALELACIKDEYYKDRDGKPAYEFTIGEFSPGQRQRLALACSFLENRDIYIFDEPTSALDAPTAIKVLYNLKKLSEEGKNVIVVTHTPELISLSDNVTIMEDMNITGNGAIMDMYHKSSYLQKTFREPSEILSTRCQVYEDNGENVTEMRYELYHMKQSEGMFGSIKTALKAGDEKRAQNLVEEFIGKIKDFPDKNNFVNDDERAVYHHLAQLISSDEQVYGFYLETAHKLEDEGSVKNTTQKSNEHTKDASKDGKSSISAMQLSKFVASQTNDH